MTLSVLVHELTNSFTTVFVPLTDDPQYGGCPEVIFKLTKLQRLNLSFQGLRMVTSYFGNLANMLELNIDHNPRLQSVASEVGLLTRLNGRYNSPFERSLFIPDLYSPSHHISLNTVSMSFTRDHPF